jgi:Holliday junction DNA helicase RuvA
VIASLCGRILEIDSNSLIIEVGGVGIEVFVPAPLKDMHQSGDRIFLNTNLIVREDSLTLYGFESKDEKELFTLLLGVNGVGPRLALAILSMLSVDEIRNAILMSQADTLFQVPGIGKKTAQKIILQLQDQIPSDYIVEPLSVTAEVDAEVLAALTALGYSIVEAQTALQSIPRDAPEDLESRLKIALQYFQ